MVDKILCFLYVSLFRLPNIDHLKVTGGSALTDNKMKLHIISILLAAAGIASAESKYISWVGEVESITEFKEGALPEGIKVGSLISGSINYDSTFAHEERNILGSHSYGTIFRFPSDVIQRVFIRDHEWIVRGADIRFSTWTFSMWTPATGRITERTDYFDIFSISSRNSVVDFPGFVGAFEMGFTVGNDSEPYQLYQSRTGRAR